MASVEPPVLRTESLGRRFGSHWALRDVSFDVRPGEVHALLGPNGAGKTTLIRALSGLVIPQEGIVEILGEVPLKIGPRGLRRSIGLIPSGDRSFYLRISGLENLIFFGRLHGLSRGEATTRALNRLDQVGLVGAARQRVGFYSHGMQKRLSIARGLLMDPPVLLVDEATHDLDPEGARSVRDLIGDIAARGAAVVWATQRLDEIRGFAGRVTLLVDGRVNFCGSVPDLLALAAPRRYLLRLRNGRPDVSSVATAGRMALGELGTLEVAGEHATDQFVLALNDEAVLGDALAAIAAAKIGILTCREERSEIEEAFLVVAGGVSG